MFEFKMLTLRTQVRRPPSQQRFSYTQTNCYDWNPPFQHGATLYALQQLPHMHVQAETLQATDTGTPTNLPWSTGGGGMHTPHMSN